MPSSPSPAKGVAAGLSCLVCSPETWHRFLSAKCGQAVRRGSLYRNGLIGRIRTNECETNLQAERARRVRNRPGGPRHQGSTPARLANHQFGREHDVAGSASPVVISRTSCRTASWPTCSVGRVDGGQRRGEIARDQRVVEPTSATSWGTRLPACAAPAAPRPPNHRPPRRSRRRPGWPPTSLRPPFAPVGPPEVAMPTSAGQRGCRARRAPPVALLAPVGIFVPCRAVQEGDPPPSMHCDQVFDHLLRARPVLHDDIGDGQPGGGGAIEQHDRKAVPVELPY